MLVSDTGPTHLVVALRNRAVLVRDRGSRLTLTRKVLDRGEAFDLIAFRGADTHLHFALGADDRGAREFARRVEISLQKTFRFGVTFGSAYTVPVESQRHLENLFWYILEQEKKHGISLDPLCEMSNLPDLLGWRLLAPWARSVTRSYLPRVRSTALKRLVPVTVDPQRPAVLEGLRTATAAALGLTDLPRRGDDFGRLVAAALGAAGPDWPARTLASALGVSLASVFRHRALDSGGPLAEAIRCQSQLVAASRLLAVG